MSILSGRSFYKMSGSGNDFVFFDTQVGSANTLEFEIESAEIISRLCSRGTGIGADGVIILFPFGEGNVGIRYYNADGSRAALCGNGTLCTARLAAILGRVDPDGFLIATDAGVLQARVRNGVPEFDLPAVMDAQPDYSRIARAPNELRLGYATVGVPHIVVQVADVDTTDVVGRGQPIRYDSSLPGGANVNFVSRASDRRWTIRTYERGVEGETLACGTGNVATAILLRMWGEADDDMELVTKSGRILGVRLRQEPIGGWHASLRGEGRLVFQGEIIDF